MKHPMSCDNSVSANGRGPKGHEIFVLDRVYSHMQDAEETIREQEVAVGDTLYRAKPSR